MHIRKTVAALWLIGRGHALLGLALIVAAKLAGTALLARLFQLTQPALMRLAWFAALYTRWTAWKEALFARVRASWAWRVGRVVKRRLAQRMVRWRGATPVMATRTVSPHRRHGRPDRACT